MLHITSLGHGTEDAIWEETDLASTNNIIVMTIYLLNGQFDIYNSTADICGFQEICCNLLFLYDQNL